MKHYLLTLLLLISGLGMAQDNPITGAPTNQLGLMGADEGTMILQNGAWKEDLSKISGVFYEFDDIRFSNMPTEGSTYLFESWKNNGVVIVGNNHFTTSNINFHINQDIIMTRMDNDSTFVYDFKGIDRIVINSRPFKSYYLAKEGKNKIFEIVYENEYNVSLLKAYYVRLSEGDPNPMLNRSRNKIKQSSRYYLLRNGSMMPLKLKKSDVQALYDGDVSNLEQFVKANKLSYKKEKDVIKILQFIYQDQS